MMTDGSKMVSFEAVTKAEQALNHLRRRILTGALPPGGKIPAERELAREWRLSRVTISKITQGLVQEGLLERRGPKGTFVVGLNGRAATIHIGFLMHTTGPQEVNPIYEAELRAFVRASHAKPVRVAFGMMGPWGETLPRSFDAASLDALVLAGAFPAEKIEPFLARRKPVVWVDEDEGTDPRALVTTDHFEAGRLATAHLLSRGRRAIVALGYPAGSYWGFERRLEGYRRAHADAGVPVDERRILRPYYSKAEHVVEILRQLERAGVTFDAVFGLCDLLGIWSIDALTRVGKRVPGDVAVISVDGLPMGEWTRPRLTTVAQPVDEVGERAFAKSLRMIETGAPGDGPERIKPSLVPRESA